jgi:hypothetical protein
MTAVVWANVLLAVPFLIAFIGIPLWMTFRRTHNGPDHTQARRYLRAKAALSNERTPAPAFSRFTSGTHSHRAAA